MNETQDIQEKILRDLAREASVIPPYISVEYLQGRVIIRGFVESEEARLAAEKACLGMEEVREVENHLLVSPPYPLAEALGPTGLD